MNDVYLGMGANLGDRARNIGSAVKKLSSFVEFKKVSSIWETSPWVAEPLQGYEEQPYFLNCAALCETQLSPPELLEVIHRIEAKAGRQKEKREKREERREKYGARVIDVDILFYNDEIINTPSLTIPHPLLHKRKFVLLPLSEIASSFIHPVIKKTIKELLRGLDSTEECKVFKPQISQIRKKWNGGVME